MHCQLLNYSSVKVICPQVSLSVLSHRRLNDFQSSYYFHDLFLKMFSCQLNLENF